jgi:hypothetical protein
MTTEEMILKQYGGSVPLSGVAKLIGRKPATIRNQICAGTFEIKTTKGFNGRHFADYREIAAHIDRMEAKAT